MPIFQETIDGVTNTNFKNLGELHSLTAAVLGQNQASHQNAMNGFRELMFAESTGQRAGYDPAEALSQSRVISADLGNAIANLAAAVASIQSSIKGGQTVPPVTP